MKSIELYVCVLVLVHCHSVRREIVLGVVRILYITVTLNCCVVPTAQNTGTNLR